MLPATYPIRMQVQVPDAPFPNQLTATVPGKAEDGPSAWIPALQVDDPEEAPGLCFTPGPVLGIARSCSYLEINLSHQVDSSVTISVVISKNDSHNRNNIIPGRLFIIITIQFPLFLQSLICHILDKLFFILVFWNVVSCGSNLVIVTLCCCTFSSNYLLSLDLGLGITLLAQIMNKVS